MTDSCPFCGKTWGTPISKHSMSKCGTRYINGIPARSSGCYETELARKDELLRGAVGIAQYCSQGGSFSFLKYGASHPIALKAQAFLTDPDVVKVMEGKP